jgi:hypothetical protein
LEGGGASGSSNLDPANPAPSKPFPISKCTAAKQYDNIHREGREPETTAGSRGNQMDWEEALLGAWIEETPLQSAAYYRRKAARARLAAKGVTTRAMKARLLDEATQFDQLAADADRGARKRPGRADDRS